MRTFVAFLAAPLVVAIGWATEALFLPGSLLDRLLEYLAWSVAIYIGAAWFTALLALPLFLLLQRFDLIRSWTSALAGLAIGCAGAALIGDFPTLEGVWRSVIGGIAGLVFWLIWRKPAAA